MSSNKRLSVSIIVILLALFVGQSVLGLLNESVTFDEPASIGSSYLAFRTGDLRITFEKPPLLGLFITGPLALFVDPPLPAVLDPNNRASDLIFGEQFMYGPGADTLGILRVSRLTVLLLSVLLGIGVAGWSFKLGGWGPAMLSTFVFSFSPNLLAHSRIAAFDMVCTIFSFLAVVALGCFLQKPNLLRACLAGVVLAMALTSKLSAVFILPVFVGAFLLQIKSPPTGTERSRLLRLQVVMGVVAFLALGALMAGQFDYGAYFGGFARIYELAKPDFEYYLAGEFSSQPRWYYSFFAVLIKTPLPFLILAVGGTVALFILPRIGTADKLLLLGPIAVLLLLSCFDAANLGVRRVLPVYPFLAVLAGLALKVPVNGAVRRWLVAVLCIWQIVSVSLVSGHHLSYFNEAIGGSKNGIYYLDDSNIDWGQDLPSLAEWLRQNPSLTPRLAYFGKGRTETYGFTLPAMSTAEICQPLAEVYAISAQLLISFERYSRSVGRDCGWLGRFEPLDRIAYSIYIFDFREPQQRELVRR